VPTTPDASDLVSDIRHHNPFEQDWVDLEVSAVEQFLSATNDDEPLHWEAKSGKVTPDHVRHAVTAFANRDGGYLIIGAERDSATGTWGLPGVELPGTEPRTWLSNIIRTSVSPPPDFDIHAWDRPNEKKAAIVQVQPNCGFLSMTGGRVYYRRPGESSYVENGAELQAIHNTVQYRSRGLPGGGYPTPHASHKLVATPSLPAAADMQTDRDSVLITVRLQLDRGDAAGLNIYLSSILQALRSAVAGGDDAAVDEALDRLTDVAALAISYHPEGPVAERSIAVMREAFDFGMQRPTGVNTMPPERLWVALLARARAVGALVVRLQHWTPLRSIVLQQVDLEGPRTWSTWFRYGDVRASRAHLYTVGNNVLESGRQPLRLAAGHALRLPSLRPDGIEDEDALITSVCQFDFLTNIIATWEARTHQPDEAALPYFAAWDGERIQSTAARLIADPASRDALLPDIRDDDLADLIRYASERANQLSQSLGSWGFWSGFIEGKVEVFLTRHPPQQPAG